MTKREFLDTVFALAPNEANKIMDAFDEYVESNVVPTGRSGKERRMSKYIIELEDDIKYLIINGRADNRCYTLVRPVAELEELNSDYINEHYGELQDEAYHAGLKDGYGTAKSLVWETSANEYTSVGINIYDWGEDESEVLRHCSAQEAVDLLHKIREHKDSDRIEVGDEVEWDGDKYVVTYLNYDIETSEITDYDLLAYDGSVVDHVKKCTFTKTGKHYDIASILEAMRE